MGDFVDLQPNGLVPIESLSELPIEILRLGEICFGEGGRPAVFPSLAPGL